MSYFTDGLSKGAIIRDSLIFGANGWSLLASPQSHQDKDDLKEVLNEIALLKKLTEYINFDCGFGEAANKNACKRGTVWGRYTSLDKKTTRLQSIGMCCCISCGNSRGHLHNFILESNLGVYEKLHKRVIGFWRPRKGCSLPIELRSSICLYHNCAALPEKRHTFDKMKLLLHNLEKRATNLNSSILMDQEKTKIN